MQAIAASAVDGSELSPTKKITILQIKEDGSVIFNNATVATLSADDITTIRFVLDFNNLEIRLYNENYKHLATQKIAIPTETGATTGEELKSCMTKYLLHIYASTKAEGTGHAVRIYGIREEDADAYSAISANSAKPIKYELNGGYLPATAPEDFSSTESTVLPTPEKPRSEFLGWYTDPSFAAGTLITEIPPSDEKTFTVYAKWYTVVIDEDYSTTEIDVVEKSVLANGIYYADNSKPGVAYKTESDSTGNYLVWTKGLKDPAILLKGDSIDLTNTSAGAMTFTFKLSKNGTDPVPDMGATFVAGRDVNGNALSPTEKITAFVIKDGVAYLGESKVEQNKLCDITSSVSEIRFVVDFDNLELRAINYRGEEITVKFSIPSTTGATNGRELMRCCYSRILNIHLISSVEERSIRLYAIRVTEGDELDS